eukprot:7963_1
MGTTNACSDALPQETQAQTDTEDCKQTDTIATSSSVCIHNDHGESNTNTITKTATTLMQSESQSVNFDDVMSRVVAQNRVTTSATFEHESESESATVYSYSATPSQSLQNGQESKYCINEHSESKTNLYAKDETLVQNGYKEIAKLRDTAQGQLLEAVVVNPDASASNTKRVIIKEVCKALHLQHIARPDLNDDMTYCIPNDVCKEALILHHLTVANRSPATCIIQFVDWFECSHSYYLVLEHLDEDCMSLKRFVSLAQVYVRNGQLQVDQYHQVIKRILWKLFILMRWMHNDMHCCHLDLKLDHVMLEGVEFVIDPQTELVTVKQDICVKLCDFGSAELFRDGVFACDKECSILQEEAYLSPLLADGQTYDARKADIWALGAMMMYCLHKSPTIHKDFEAYTDLLEHMMEKDEDKRYLTMDILQHKWFESYYRKYEHSTKTKSQTICAQQKLKHLLYYVPIQKHTHQ